MISPWKLLTFCTLCGGVAASGQIISVNTPTPWTTQRSDSILVRAQIDTAQVKKKAVDISVQSVSAGKKKLLGKKSFKVTDFSGEFYFGTVKKDLVGGADYLEIDWSIPGGTDKGTIAPIGIVNVAKLPAVQPIAVTHVKDGASAEDVVAAVKDYSTVGSGSFSLAWNRDALFIITSKSPDSSVLKFAIDGKVGKNAFLSYPDRIVVYSPVKDSAWGMHYKRALVKDTLKYTDAAWQNGLTKTNAGGKTCIRIPWYDTGILPFDQRTIGFGVFEVSTKSAVSATLPKTAQYYIPGTWGEIKLSK